MKFNECSVCFGRYVIGLQASGVLGAVSAEMTSPVGTRGARCRPWQDGMQSLYAIVDDI